VVLKFTPEKTWQGVVFPSADIKEGETYTVTAGDYSDTVTVDSVAVSNSTSNMGGGGGRGF
jgi:hypothetical protein